MITKHTELLRTGNWYEKQADEKTHFLDKVYGLFSYPYHPSISDNIEQQMNHNKKIILHVGGEDVRMRIPMLNIISTHNFNVGAIGCEDYEAFERTDIPYFNYTLHRWLTPLADETSKKQLASIFNSVKPDLIHLFDTKPGVITPKVAKKSGVKHVVRTVTGMGYIFSSNTFIAQLLKPFYRFFQKRAIAYTDIVIFQNEDDKAYFEKYKLVPREKSMLVRSSGLNVEEFLKNKPSQKDIISIRKKLNANENDIVVTMVARLVKDKGVLEFLETAKKLSRFSNIKFVLVGPLGSEGKQAIERKTIEYYSQYVNYIGSVSKVVKVLSASDIFVLPTYYREGLPRILLEAGALGLPLITTDMPGCRDVVKDGWNGFLVPTRDSNALVNAVKKLSDNKELREKMGAKNPIFIKNNFSLSQVANAYIKIYNHLLDKDKDKIR